MFDDNL